MGTSLMIGSVFIDKSRYKETIRVRIMDKQFEDGVWKKKLIRHIGTAKSELDLKFLNENAKEVLYELKHKNQLALEFPGQSDMTGLRTVGEYHQGADLVLGTLMDRIGISSPNLSLLRQLVIARILYPVSKIRTVSFLNRSFGAHLEKDQVYRFLDSLSKSQEEILGSLREYVTTNYPASFNFILYDVTTLYFETDHDDEDVAETGGLRKRGYSKDKRDDLPQAVLGLGVNALGMPLTYRLYPGNTYEGSTLIRGIDDTLKCLNHASLTVVGDAGMLSEKNLVALEERDLTYIVGARLKSLPNSLEKEILSLDFTDEMTKEIVYKNRRLVVSYSPSRAKRAISQRKRSVARLEQLIAKNQAVRRHQYLDFTIKEKPKIDQMAVEAASKWDGIKGYFTNNFNMSAGEVIDHYRDLYKVEQSFRMSKTDLRIRPTFHFRQSRIEAHVIICMLGLCVLRMLEQQVKPLGLTYKSALDEISFAKAAILELGNQTFIAPPKYRPAMQQIVRSIESSGN